MCSSNWTMISPYRTTNSSNKIMSDKSLKTQKRKLYDIYSNQLTMACRIQFLRGRLETAGSRFSTRKSVYRLYCFWHKLNVKKKKTESLRCWCARVCDIQPSGKHQRRPVYLASSAGTGSVWPLHQTARQTRPLITTQTITQIECALSICSNHF